MRKIYSRPETRLRACIRPMKENATNLPFFHKGRKTWPAEGVPECARSLPAINANLPLAFANSASAAPLMRIERVS
jgi:hypothetical protein